MNELKYCKFCDKEKPVKDFVKSGFAIKNICRECQNQKQTQIYKNNKKVEQLQQENKQLKEKLDCDLQWALKYEKQVGNWNTLKKWLEEKWEKSQDIWFVKIINKMHEIERGNKFEK